jgi:hypothetical protein
MTASTLTALAPGNWTPLAARSLNALVAVLLLGSSATGAPRPQEPAEPSAAGPSGAEVREAVEPARASGTPYALEGRSRFETRFGVSNLNVTHDERTDTLDVTGGDFSLAFVHWPHENVALELSTGVTNLGVSSRRTFHGDRVHSEGLYRVMAGARFYLPVAGAFRPHLDLAGGVLTEVDVHDSPWYTEVNSRTARAGLEVGGGVDAATLVREGYRSELTVGCNLGWAFGGRRPGR